MERNEEEESQVARVGYTGSPDDATDVESIPADGTPPSLEGVGRRLRFTPVADGNGERERERGMR